MRSASLWWIIPLVSLLLVIQPISTHAESDTSSIIAAEGISLSVDFGNGTSLDFNDLNGATVLDVTSEVLDVNVQWYGPLAYIRGIEGIVGAGENGWQYWVNGEFASIAVNLFTLDDADTVEWIFSGPITQQQEDSTLIPGVVAVSLSGLGFLAMIYVQTLRRLR